MSKASALVLGVDGMLGHKVYDVLRQDPDLRIYGTTRRMSRLDDNKLFYFNALYNDDCIPWDDFDYIINCIGAIKPHIDEDNPCSVSDAIKLNSLLPQMLAGTSCRVIHASTDCVFSGDATKKFIRTFRNEYLETDDVDASDVYGRSKILGECPHNMNIRVSIIGPQLPDGGPKSLLEWYLAQDPDSTVDGYATHSWNGISTLQWARNAVTIIKGDLWQVGTFHTGSEMFDKAEILQLIKEAYAEHGVETAAINVRRDMTPKWMNLRTVEGMFYAELQMLSLREQIKEMAGDHCAQAVQGRYHLRNSP